MVFSKAVFQLWGKLGCRSFFSDQKLPQSTDKMTHAAEWLKRIVENAENTKKTKSRETRSRFAEGAERIGTSTEHFRDRNRLRLKSKSGFLDEKVAAAFSEGNKKPKLAQKNITRKTNRRCVPRIRITGGRYVQFCVKP